jgi:multidrug efflux pump subunit AcrB
MVAGLAEQVLSQIQGIEHSYSVSRPGVAVLTVQFKVGVPRTETLVRLYDMLNASQDWLPQGLGVLTPIVKPKGINNVPVLAATLWTKDAASALDLQRVAHSVESEPKRLPGTREVVTIGGSGRAVHVWLEPNRLRERGVSVQALHGAIAAANQAMSSGSVANPAAAPGEPGLQSVQTGEFLQNAKDVGDIVVGVSQGRPIYLREVARVEAGAQLPQRCVWFTPGAADTAHPEQQGQSHPAVTITVTKKPGENAVDVAAGAREPLHALRNTVIPEDVEVAITCDHGQTAANKANKANKLIQKLIFATGSVIILVGLALGRREAIIVGAAVILTLTATLFASWAWGFTLNRVCCSRSSSPSASWSTTPSWWSKTSCGTGASSPTSRCPSPSRARSTRWVGQPFWPPSL